MAVFQTWGQPEVTGSRSEKEEEEKEEEAAYISSAFRRTDGSAAEQWALMKCFHLVSPSERMFNFTPSVETGMCWSACSGQRSCCWPGRQQLQDERVKVLVWTSVNSKTREGLRHFSSCWVLMRLQAAEVKGQKLRGFSFILKMLIMIDQFLVLVHMELKPENILSISSTFYVSVLY